MSLTWAKPPWELPPRARRIPHPPSRGRSSPGTTSACAENTGLLRLINPPKGNYLRVRGEYCSQAKSCVSRWELPPRARRIPPAADGIPQSPGTTSACAENTHKNTPCMIWRWNYLRVRGEYLLPVKQMIPPAELPPRARRIRVDAGWISDDGGTTSACAENTSHQQSAPALPRNYLRVRGEYAAGCGVFVDSAELPPRARRIQSAQCPY